MAYSDKILGAFLLALSFSIFVYYSVWVLLLPFVEVGSPLWDYFLAKEYAISIPATLLVIGLVVVGMFIGITLSRLGAKKKS
ncbi:dolichol phosphate-mannose biosynthesis regulatory, partial [Ochromonadaceae sp. CCMP2298]